MIERLPELEVVPGSEQGQHHPASAFGWCCEAVKPHLSPWPGTGWCQFSHFLGQALLALYFIHLFIQFSLDSVQDQRTFRRNQQTLQYFDNPKDRPQSPSPSTRSAVGGLVCWPRRLPLVHYPRQDGIISNRNDSSSSSSSSGAFTACCFSERYDINKLSSTLPKTHDHVSVNESDIVRPGNNVAPRSVSLQLHRCCTAAARDVARPVIGRKV